MNCKIQNSKSRFQYTNPEFRNFLADFLVFMLPMSIIIFSIFSACWFYSFKGTLPPHIKSIAIPAFQDQTAEFNIQEIVTDQIRNKFIQENLLKLSDKDNSNSILYGTILSIQDRPLVFEESASGEAVKEYRLTIRVEVEWYDMVYNKILFKKQFTGYSEYDPTGATDRVRETALSESMSQISDDIINSILAGW